MAGQVAAHRQVAPYTTKRAVVEDYCRRLPQAPALTLAKLIVEENEGLFPSVDAARSTVRDVFGLDGERSRKFATQDLMRAPRKPHDPRTTIPPCLPQSLKDLEDWRIVDVACDRALVFSDEHVPYHCEEALELAIKWGMAFDPDLVLLNGDQCDCYSLSAFERDPRRRFVKEEVYSTREYFAYLRHRFPKARIIWKIGNHEERWLRLFWTQATPLFGLDVLDFESVFMCRDLGIEVVQDKKPIRLGRLHVVHGHEFGKVSSAVNPARTYYLRGRENVLGGHLHRKSNHTETTMNGSTVSAWSCGCLCDLHPRYAPLNQWDHSFAGVEMDGQEFQVIPKAIINGRVW